MDSYLVLHIKHKHWKSNISLKLLEIHSENCLELLNVASSQDSCGTT